MKKNKIVLDDQYEALFEHSHDAMIISNLDTEIVLVNKATEKIFGYKQDELIGSTILNLMPEGRKSNYIEDIEHAINSKVISNVNNGEEYLAMRKNGEVFPVEVTFTGLKSGKNQFFQSQIRDITKRKTYQSDLESSRRTLMVISECNKALVNAENEQIYFQDICNLLVDYGGYKVAWIGLIKHDDIQSIEPIAYSGFKKGHFEHEIISKGRMTWKMKTDSNTGPTARAVNSKKEVFCNNIQTDPVYEFWRKEAIETGYSSQISIPLVVDHSVKAVLVILSENPEAFNKEEVKLLRELTNDIEFGIKSLWLKKAQKEIESTLIRNENRLIQLNKLLLVTSECNKALTRSRNTTEYLQAICRILVEKGGNSKSLIQEVKYEDEVFVNPVAIYGEKIVSQANDKFDKRTKINGLSRCCLVEERPIVYQNVIESGNYVYWNSDPKKVLFQSTVAIPLFKGNAVAWILRVFSKESLAFGSRELELLKDLANDIVFGIDSINGRKEKLLTENKLSESEEKYKNLFQYSNDAIFIADAETGIIIDANKKAEDLLGVSKDDIIGMHQTDLHPPEDKDKYISLFKAHLSSKKKVDQFYIVDKTGKHVPVHVSASTTKINGKKVIQGIFRDISETKKEEEKLRQSQKMEALGTLSGGIAHDFNNILSPIIGYSELVKLESDENKKNHYLTEILTASHRAKDLVRQILTFCRKGESEMKPFKVQPIVKEALKLIKVSLPSNIETEIEINNNCGEIMCDPTQIHQIIMNLCTNAYHAMKENGGILKVVLNCGETCEFITDQLEEVIYKSSLCIEISDTGCGMTKNILERIYEPYYTTKGKDEGTGLGLSVVLGIVRGHGGRIYTKSYPGEGSLFRIFFPLLDQKENDNHVHEVELIKGGNEHIMVVDDEQILSEIISTILLDLGYKTTQFNSSLEALKEFKKNPEKYDMIFTDQTMPKMVGSELAIEALKIRNDIPIILCTGYSPIISREKALEMGIKEFVMKPLTRSTLANTVRSVFDSI